MEPSCCWRVPCKQVVRAADRIVFGICIGCFILVVNNLYRITPSSYSPPGAGMWRGEEEQVPYRRSQQEAHRGLRYKALYRFSGLPENGSLEWRSLFYGVDVDSENRRAVKGGPLEYLDNYANPCWLARYDREYETGPYGKNLYLQKVIKSPDFYGAERSDEVSAFAARMAAQVKVGNLIRPRCLPGVFFIGVSKSGTADLYQNLIKHPDLHQPGVKEPQWWTHYRFGHGEERPKMTLTLADYLDNYDMPARAIYTQTTLLDDKEYHPGLTIDSSTWSLYHYPWQLIPGNAGLTEPRYIMAHSVKALYPDAKVIVILRNPTDRLYSHWRESNPKHYPDVFHNKTVAALSRFRSCLYNSTMRACAYNFRPKRKIEQGMILYGSLYYPFIRDWLDVFGHRQMMVVKAEEYYNNRSKVLTAAFDFLGLASMDKSLMDKIQSLPPTNTKKANKRSATDMLPETRELLDQFFLPVNKKMEQLMSDPRWSWQDG